MTVFHLDTSSLVKRYKTEKGTDVIDILFDAALESKKHRLSTSFFTIIEVTSAFRRLLKGKELTREQFDNAINVFSREMEDFSIRPLDEDVVIDALEIVSRHALRSADSIQLATALRFRDALTLVAGELVFVCDDQALRDAGRKEGMRAISASEKDAMSELELMLSK